MDSASTLAQWCRDHQLENKQVTTVDGHECRGNQQAPGAGDPNGPCSPEQLPQEHLTSRNTLTATPAGSHPVGPPRPEAKAGQASLLNLLVPVLGSLVPLVLSPRPGDLLYLLVRHPLHLQMTKTPSSSAVALATDRLLHHPPTRLAAQMTAPGPPWLTDQLQQISHPWPKAQRLLPPAPQPKTLWPLNWVAPWINFLPIIPPPHPGGLHLLQAQGQSLHCPDLGMEVTSCFVTLTSSPFFLS